MKWMVLVPLGMCGWLHALLEQCIQSFQLGSSLRRWFKQTVFQLDACVGVNNGRSSRCVQDMVPCGDQVLVMTHNNQLVQGKIKL
jgi:hypothetical protein